MPDRRGGPAVGPLLSVAVLTAAVAAAGASPSPAQSTAPPDEPAERLERPAPRPRTDRGFRSRSRRAVSRRAPSDGADSAHRQPARRGELEVGGRRRRVRAAGAVRGRPPRPRATVVRLLYDARALYIGVEAFDSRPEAVIATEMRRDSPRLLDEDNFQIILDTFRDRRSGYMFVTSPLGAKLEQQVAEEGEGGFRGSNSPNVNVNWDGVWDVRARRTADGWVAEIAIPMVTLRFPDAERQVLGRQLHAQHPAQERAGVLGADLQGVHADAGSAWRGR